MAKPSYVLSRTKCVPVEDTMRYANSDGSKVCAVSALLVERGYKIKENTSRRIIYNPEGKRIPDSMITLLEKEYGMDILGMEKVIGAFNEGKEFKKTAKILREQGL